MYFKFFIVSTTFEITINISANYFYKILDNRKFNISVISIDFGILTRRTYAIIQKKKKNK